MAWEGPEPTITSPVGPTATQSSTEGHETLNGAMTPRAMSMAVQSFVPALGRVEVKASPLSSTATHNDADAQETSVNGLPLR